MEINELAPWLAAPVLVLVGVIIKGFWDTLAQKMQQRVASRSVDVSEREAETHQWQAIVDGFTQSLAAVNARATTAEATGQRALDRADLLEKRLTKVEGEREALLRHLIAVEKLVPNPPGPPPRPTWLI